MRRFDLASAAYAAAIGAAVLAVAGAVLFGSAARGEPIEPGWVRVIDGDTVAVASATYRLVGFEPPTGPVLSLPLVGRRHGFFR